jgi:foldase protein PrsA
VRRLLLSLFALLAAVGLLASCGSLAAYAAIVNGHRVSEKDVDSELIAIRGNARYLDTIDPSRRQILGSGANTFNAHFTAQILTRRVYYELVHIEVQRRHLNVTTKDINDARQAVIQQFQGQPIFDAFPKSYQLTLERRTAEVAVLEKALGGQPSDADLHAYYDAHTNQFEQACASHVLVDTKDQADAVEARLAKGEDFAAVAKSASKDPGSAQKGGDVGCFGRDAQLVPEFLQAIFTQPVGQVGPPVQSQFGFHVIKVTSRHVLSFDEAKDQVRQAVSQGNQTKLTDWLRGALQKAKVTVNPKFGKFDKNQPTPGVVEPQAPQSASTSTSIQLGVGSGP